MLSTAVIQERTIGREKNKNRRIGNTNIYYSIRIFLCDLPFPLTVISKPIVSSLLRTTGEYYVHTFLSIVRLPLIDRCKRPCVFYDSCNKLGKGGGDEKSERERERAIQKNEEKEE
jgi:hypothetical protein